MIPANLSLVPLSPERRAAMQAIAEVEKKYERGVHIAEFAWAHAFFRILNGSKRITVKDIGWFSPGLTAQALRGKKQDWLAAIDRLIESRGACCWLPLSVSDGWRLFPETKFQMSERCRRQNELSAEKYTRQRRREACQRETAYQALAGQAEIELAFHTPETVSSWSARWSGTELHQYDLEDMFWRWSERFPSLAGFERWLWQGVPLWKIVYEAGLSGREASAHVRELERWMVPNKLREMA
ncbi:plasmid SOS inhibition protein A [Salmonella enterica subsp. enterica serovar Newport]|nr:plasmid SOS inhibition protein A [Salmonella enterica subsp. enterica serovar Newport]EDW4369263.1 plasmid SOS inhibition protein A [Salmonella enterica subsp. diarizonae]EII9568407.1 plasmid SOS inhibition protein A [Salmonella enterica]